MIRYCENLKPGNEARVSEEKSAVKLLESAHLQSQKGW